MGSSHSMTLMSGWFLIKITLSRTRSSRGRTESGHCPVGMPGERACFSAEMFLSGEEVISLQGNSIEARVVPSAINYSWMFDVSTFCFWIKQLTLSLFLTVLSPSIDVKRNSVQVNWPNCREENGQWPCYCGKFAIEKCPYSGLLCVLHGLCVNVDYDICFILFEARWRSQFGQLLGHWIQNQSPCSDHWILAELSNESSPFLFCTLF